MAEFYSLKALHWIKRILYFVVLFLGYKFQRKRISLIISLDFFFFIIFHFFLKYTIRFLILFPKYFSAATTSNVPKTNIEKITTSLDHMVLLSIEMSISF